MTNDNEININDITAVILAGGRAKRMGGKDKGLIKVNDRFMIEFAIEKLLPQVGHLLINANRNLEQYKSLNHPVVSDDNISDYNGPLAGMLSALKACTTKYILTIPCDSPFFPDNLSIRFLSTLIESDADICVAHDGKRMQPVFALIKSELSDSLQNYLDNGDRKIDLWYNKHHTVLADLSDFKDISLNINTPEELINLEQKLTEYKNAC